jgi:hypothetical protein
MDDDYPKDVEGEDGSYKDDYKDDEGTVENEEKEPEPTPIDIDEPKDDDIENEKEEEWASGSASGSGSGEYTDSEEKDDDAMDADAESEKSRIQQQDDEEGAYDSLEFVYSGFCSLWLVVELFFIIHSQIFISPENMLLLAKTYMHFHV